MTKFGKKIRAFERWLRPSPAEKKFMQVMGFWYFVRYTVQREKYVSGYYVDFAVPTHRVIIEIDGKKYHGGVRDILRDAAIEKLGWHVLRVPASQLWRDPKRVRREVYLFTKSPKQWVKTYGEH